MAELMLGQPIFPGESGVDQLVEIIKVLGTPTREQIKAMNRNYTEYKFPQIKAAPWNKVYGPIKFHLELTVNLNFFFKQVFKNKPTTPESVELMSKLLEYTPVNRVTAIEAMAHSFFDELRRPETKMPTGKELPPLFDFSPLGMSVLSPFLLLDRCLFYSNFTELSIQPDLNRTLVPPHAEPALRAKGIELDKFQPVQIQRPSLND